MIVPLNSGAQVVLGECLWIPGAYISVGNVRGSQGAIMEPDEIDQVIIAELGRIRAVIAERAAAATEQRRSDADGAISGEDRQRRCA